MTRDSETPAPAGSIAERRRTALLFTAIYIGLVAAIGFATHAWTRGPAYDEANFYLPALEFFSKRWPQIFIKDYPFPTPPLLITLQSWFFGAMNGSVAATRLLSTGAAVLTAACLIHSGIRQSGRMGGVLALGVVCFPVFLWLSFTVKHYAFIDGLILVGLDQWRRWSPEERGRSWVVSGALLAVGTASSQFVVPICCAMAANAAHVWWLDARQKPFPWGAALAAAVPLAVAGGFILLWGGAQPPTWSRMSDKVSAVYRLDPRQTLLGLIMLGFWVAPLSRSAIRLIKPACLLWIPSALAVWLSGLYKPGTDFDNTPIGPVSNMLTFIVNRTEFAAVAIAGLIVAAGVSYLFFGREKSSDSSLIRWMVITHALMMTVSVPCLFESYYTTLLMPVLWLVGLDAVRSPANRLSVTWLVFICIAGVAGSVVQLRKPPVTPQGWVQSVFE